MPLTIPDEVLQQAGLTERAAAIEIACRLFGAQILSQPAASRLCGLSRLEFEEECYKRCIPVYIYTREMLQQDLDFIRSDGDKRAGGE